jgi:hypothetical protein
LSELYTEFLVCIDVLQTKISGEKLDSLKTKSGDVFETLKAANIEVKKDEGLYDMRYVQIEQGIEKDSQKITDSAKREAALLEVATVLYDRFLARVMKSTNNIETLSKLMKLK